MSQAHLFQLGMDLDAGTTHAEGSRDLEGRFSIVADNSAEQAIFDDARDDHFIRRDGEVFAGTHLIIEVIDGKGLDDQERIERAFRDCVDVCGATLLHIHTHKFSPQGVSGVAVLAESHISVHTWPEIGYGAFDVFMCGDAQPWKAVDVLRDAFTAKDVRVKEILRGQDIVAARL